MIRSEIAGFPALTVVYCVLDCSAEPVTSRVDKLIRVFKSCESVFLVESPEVGLVSAGSKGYLICLKASASLAHDLRPMESTAGPLFPAVFDQIFASLEIRALSELWKITRRRWHMEGYS